MMGTKIRSFAPLPSDLSLEDLVVGRPPLPAPGGGTRPLFREEVGGAALRKRWQAFRRPGGLLQAAARHVLREPEERDAAHAGGLRSPLFALVPRIRPLRAAPGPLLAHPHQGSTRLRGLPELLRADRLGVRPGWCGARSFSSTPPRSRPTPPSIQRGRALCSLTTKVMTPRGQKNTEEPTSSPFHLVGIIVEVKCHSGR
jgi:hypothetical protein